MNKTVTQDACFDWVPSNTFRQLFKIYRETVKAINNAAGTVLFYLVLCSVAIPIYEHMAGGGTC